MIQHRMGILVNRSFSQWWFIISSWCDRDWLAIKGVLRDSATIRECLVYGANSLWEFESERPVCPNQISLAEFLKFHTTWVTVLRERANNIDYIKNDLISYSIAKRILIPQLYVLSKYPLYIDTWSDNAKMWSQETNGIYLFVIRCWTLILNLQLFRPPPKALRSCCLQW